MRIGDKYRNKQGVELTITEFVIDPNILGTLAKAAIPDQLFGDRRVMVTKDGLEDAGYEKVQE